jgi:hypothetical protein
MVLESSMQGGRSKWRLTDQLSKVQPTSRHSTLHHSSRIQGHQTAESIEFSMR